MQIPPSQEVSGRKVQMTSRSKQGFSTDIWGGGGIWLFLHIVSLNYPCRPTRLERRRYHTFFKMLQYILPCSACRRSTSDFYKRHGTRLTPDVFKSRDTLASWLWRLHNRVNRRLGKRCSLSFKTMCRKYESFRADCNAHKHGCEAPANKPKKRAVVVILDDQDYKKLRLKSSIVGLRDVRRPIRAHA